MCVSIWTGIALATGGIYRSEFEFETYDKKDHWRCEDLNLGPQHMKWMAYQWNNSLCYEILCVTSRKEVGHSVTFHK